MSYWRWIVEFAPVRVRDRLEKALRQRNRNIGENVGIAPFCHIPAGITIGNNVSIGAQCHFVDGEYLTIEDDVIIATRSRYTAIQ
jgi:acetyltransferase-like isoleucine patch superfamily enzyme